MAQTSPTRAPSIMTMPVGAFANENDPEDDTPPVPQPSSLARRLMRAVQWVEQRNHAAAVHGDPPVYDSRLFPWVADLEGNWTTVRGELARLMMRRDALLARGDRSSPTIGEDRGWTTFVLASYFRRHESHIAQCPETWRLVQRVPGLVSVMFSVLEPGQRLPAHVGPYNGLLRLHLGLIVPEPREAVAIRIDGRVHHWQEGRALIFDDTYEHEARNESGHTRVVLFVDFERPLSYPARLINRRVLRSLLFRPFVREGAQDQGRLAQRLYREARALREEIRATLVGNEAPLDLTNEQVAEARPARTLTLAETLEREWPVRERQR